MIPDNFQTSCRYSGRESKDSRHCTATSRLFVDDPWMDAERTLRKACMWYGGRSVRDTLMVE